MNALIRSTVALLAPLAVACSLSSSAAAQCASCQRSAPYASWLPAAASAPTVAYSPLSTCLSCQGGQEYKLLYQTVYDQHQTTAYRVENETVYEERTVTTLKPVWEPQTREVRYRVAKPVVETSAREERYTVQKPVWETQVRDCSYDRVRWEAVQCEREQRTLVARPVYETAERDESYTVMRPVYQTTYRTQYRTVMQPVQTCQTQLVDQGCYVNQMVMKPSVITNKLAWQSGQSVCDPLTGKVVYQRPGLYWEPVQQGRYEVNRVWQPNVVAQQVQQTALVPQTVAEQIPVNSVTYQPEQVCRKVPYTVCRTVQQEVVQKIPYTVMRPVTERVENKVSVQVCRMETEVRVRQVPVTTTRVVYEDRVDQQTVQVCRMVPVQQTVRVPRCVEKRTPLTYTYYTPRTVCARIPLDPCGNPIETTVTAQPEPAATTTQETVLEGAPAREPAAAPERTLRDVPPAQEPTPAAAPANRPASDAADQQPRLDREASSLGVGPTDLRANASSGPDMTPPAKSGAGSEASSRYDQTAPKAGGASDWSSKARAKAQDPAKVNGLDSPSSFKMPSSATSNGDQTPRKAPAPLGEVHGAN